MNLSEHYSCGHPSPAACGRGLKPLEVVAKPREAGVARRVRAWIETINGGMTGISLIVARRVRAWIETAIGERTCTRTGVARRVRAWIETAALAQTLQPGLSPAACGRGLKQGFSRGRSDRPLSPAACGRGLKHVCTPRPRGRARFRIGKIDKMRIVA